MHDGRQYLVERFELSYLSAPEALLQSAPSAAMTSQQQALIVGYSEQGRLPQSISEARQVTETLEPVLQPICLIEEAATIDALRRQPGACSLLHLATHAVFRPDNPLFSWIRLADGRLTVADLYEIRLPGRPLVVLSACETGRGQARGGGLLGMGRGFLAAGAAGIVVSLWKIDDTAAALFMQDFYVALQTGSPADPATALCQAHRRACARGAHPQDWAAFLFIAG
jgi:CHAT domain-containing protein